MAKSNIGGQFSWKRDNNVLIVYFIKIGEKRLDSDLAEATFDLTIYYPDFNKYDKSQQENIAYGAKQKLADSTALPETVLSKDERIGYMKDTWARIAVERDWNSKAKADPDKVKVSQRELGKLDSLLDLRAMKLLDGKAGFIMPEEAKVKLVELEELVVKEEKKVDKKKKK